jgi:hypothetical protein
MGVYMGRYHPSDTYTAAGPCQSMGQPCSAKRGSRDAPAAPGLPPSGLAMGQPPRLMCCYAPIVEVSLSMSSMMLDLSHGSHPDTPVPPSCVTIMPHHKS